MPKIIENVREQLLAEAKRQIAERGYANTTVRSVASACSLATGTVYNYFDSKEMLIATFVAEDWKKYLENIAACPESDMKALLLCIYNSLIDFSEGNKRLFSDADAAKVISIGFSAKHKRLRKQISDFILPACRYLELADAEYTSEFISEALIAWSADGKPFASIYKIIEKIIKK